MKKLITISAPALGAAAVVSAALVEVWIRVTWDPARGRPGFFVADPVRTEKLSPGYDGWFAGVPVRINALGFRDVREYRLEMLSDGTPAVSSHDAFARYRPSQMPEARHHSIGNANALKARVLFEFLRDYVLVPLLQKRELETA